MGYVTQQSKIFPMTYPLGEAYIRQSFPLMEERDLEIVCTLRENHGDQARGRVKTWVNEYAKIAGLNVKAGEVSHLTLCSALPFSVSVVFISDLSLLLFPPLSLLLLSPSSPLLLCYSPALL
jgi:hypothetical protein